MMRLIQDLDFAHRRRWPRRPVSHASRAWLLASSASLRLLLIHRLVHWLHANRSPGGWRAGLWRVVKLSVALPKWVCQVSAKSEISNDCDLEGGVCFSDQGFFIFGPKNAGAGTVVGTRVTFGKSHVDDGLPEVGRNVWIGSDCVVFGAICIGDGATLLPGTVLTKSIPPGVVMQGNPAQLIMHDFDNAELRAQQEVDVMQYMKKKGAPECLRMSA